MNVQSCHNPLDWKSDFLNVFFLQSWQDRANMLTICRNGAIRLQSSINPNLTAGGHVQALNVGQATTYRRPSYNTSIVDNLQSKYNWDRLTSITFRFCLLAHRPPQSLKLQRHQGKHDGDCRPLQKRQRVDGPQVLVPKMRRQSAYSDAMPSAFGLLPSAYSLWPSAISLLP